MSPSPRTTYTNNILEPTIEDMPDVPIVSGFGTTSGQSPLGSSFIFWANCLIVQGGCSYILGSGVTVPHGLSHTLGLCLPYHFNLLFVSVLFWVLTVRRFSFQ